MRQIAIRTMRAWEYNLLKNFVYEAIYVPPGSASLPKSITDRPELQVYFHRFGCGRWDKAFVALDGERIVGAIWCRLMDDYGHVDDETPSLAMALYQEYRGCGIGTTLLRTMLGALKKGRGPSGFPFSTEGEPCGQPVPERGFLDALGDGRGIYHDKRPAQGKEYTGYKWG